jgi:signal-transduction protein with cAMP-binding, CBS, and nucleotidyltransferase domain
MAEVHITPQQQQSEELTTLRRSLAEHDLFAGLDGAQLAALIPASRIKEFDDEEITCKCHDASHEAFVLLAGTVAISESDGTTERTVEMAGFGSVVNFAGLLGLVRPLSKARALGRVQALAVDTRLLAEAMERDARVGFVVTRNLAKLMVAQRDRQIAHLIG